MQLLTLTRVKDLKQEGGIPRGMEGRWPEWNTMLVWSQLDIVGSQQSGQHRQNTGNNYIEDRMENMHMPLPSTYSINFTQDWHRGVSSTCQKYFLKNVNMSGTPIPHPSQFLRFQVNALSLNKSFLRVDWNALEGIWHLRGMLCQGFFFQVENMATQKEKFRGPLNIP